MKPRPNGFLSPEHIDHDSEVFDYIRELHEYLHRFVRAAGFAPCHLSDSIDKALAKVEAEQ